MSTAAYELGFLKASIEILDAYLLSDDLFWTIGENPPAGEQPYRQLTLGSLLLIERRLQARRLPSDLELERQACVERIRDYTYRRRVAWERKASREFPARLRLWANFLNEYRDDPMNHADRYAYEVERRVMLQLLEPYARETPHAELDLLNSLDRLLEVVLIPGNFIWEADISGGFERADFWYLFGRLRQ